MDGLSLTQVSARVDEAAAIKGCLRLHVDRALLRLGPKGISALLPPGDKIALDHLEEGRGFLRTSLTPLGGMAQVTISLLADGRISLRLIAFTAAGFLPVPRSVVMGALRTFLPAAPGVTIAQESVDLDLRTLLGHLTEGQPVELQLGALRSVAIARDCLVLEI